MNMSQINSHEVKTDYTNLIDKYTPFHSQKNKVSYCNQLIEHISKVKNEMPKLFNNRNLELFEQGYATFSNSTSLCERNIADFKNPKNQLQDGTGNNSKELTESIDKVEAILIEYLQIKKKMNLQFNSAWTNSLYTIVPRYNSVLEVYVSSLSAEIEELYLENETTTDATKIVGNLIKIKDCLSKIEASLSETTVRLNAAYKGITLVGLSSNLNRSSYLKRQLENLKKTVEDIKASATSSQLASSRDCMNFSLPLTDGIVYQDPEFKLLKESELNVERCLKNLNNPNMILLSFHTLTLDMKKLNNKILSSLEHQERFKKLQVSFSSLQNSLPEFKLFPHIIKFCNPLISGLVEFESSEEIVDFFYVYDQCNTEFFDIRREAEKLLTTIQYISQENLKKTL